MALPAGDLVLPVHLRMRLARAFGPVVSTEGLVAAVAGRSVAAVGDVVAMTCLQLGITPKLVACDMRTQRGEEDPGYERILGSWGDRRLDVVNPAAHITRQAWIAIQEGLASEGSTCIVVDGEEDLLGLPVLVEAPEGTVLLYGMPGQGVVVATVTAELRSEARALVDEMLVTKA